MQLEGTRADNVFLKSEIEKMKEKVLGYQGSIRELQKVEIVLNE